MQIAIRSRSPLDYIAEFAPSVGWVGLMLLPLAFQYQDLHPTGRALQMTVVCAIALLLFLADWVSFGKARRRSPGLDPCRSTGWLIVAGLCFLLPAALHLVLMPKIPLLALVMDKGATENSLTMLRLESGKLLAVPSIVMYLFNWSLVVFAPIHTVVAFLTGHRRQAVYGLLIASLYAAATWAKFPIVLLLATCLFACCVVPGPLRRVLCLGLAGSIVLSLCLLAVLFATGSLAHLKSAASHAEDPVIAQMQPDDPRRALTYGDNFRFDAAVVDTQRSRFRNALEYVVYRAWLTPSDVSNRWYQYFTYVKKEPLGLRSMFRSQSSAGAQAPSREVGLWAYRARFPYKYWDTVSAYASFDADAFARGGVAGVVLATVLLLAARLGAAFLVTAHPAGLTAYAVLLCVLAILPSFASIQAIFGANGLAIVLALLVLIRFTARGADPMAPSLR